MSQPQESPKSLGPSLARTNLSIGDRVITPTGRTGRILPPKADLPLHCLILFDDDRTFWMLKEILQPAPAMATKKRRAIA